MRTLLLCLLLPFVLLIRGCATPPTPPPKPDLLAAKLPPELIFDEQCGGAHWPRYELPLKVFITPSAALWAPVVGSAMAWWGSELFTATTTTADADVIVLGDSDLLGQAVTLLRFSHQTCVIDAPALVVFPWVGPGPSGMHMAQHELGHVLGLDHDPDNKDSIMYPTVHEPLLQGNDRRRLRDTYGVDPLAVP